jgi:hypothetical protein
VVERSEEVGLDELGGGLGLRKATSNFTPARSFASMFSMFVKFARGP